MRHLRTFKKQDQGGFTLVELLAALAILGFVLAALYSFYFAGLSGWNRGIARMDSQQSARIAMDIMVRELRSAEFAAIPESSQICFRLKGDNRIYRFRKAGEEIVFESLIGSSVYSHTKVALGITGLAFSTDVTHTITITVIAGSADQRVTLTSKVRPRNIP